VGTQEDVGMKSKGGGGRGGGKIENWETGREGESHAFEFCQPESKLHYY